MSFAREEGNLKTLKASFAEFEKRGLDNTTRRQLYSRVELLRLDFEETALASLSGDANNIKETNEKSDDKDENTNNNNSSAQLIPPDINDQLNTLIKSLKLVPLRRKRHWWHWFDLIFRFFNVCVGFLFMGIFCSLPIIALRVVDAWLKLDGFSQLSEKLKRSLSVLILKLSAIEVSVEGVDRKSFSESCVLLAFSHASNLDGFLVSSTCPIRHYALAKKELFVVPFFSWISLAIGGVPVDRGNRERAIAALNRSTQQAKGGKSCLVISPEGTRSTTGQLLPFKKGVAYMWEQLQAPIVPVVFFDTWDLYPVGSWINVPGHVTVRYLPAILPSEATSREHMLRLVRISIIKYKY